MCCLPNPLGRNFDELPPSHPKEFAIFCNEFAHLIILSGDWTEVQSPDHDIDYSLESLGSVRNHFPNDSRKDCIDELREMLYQFYDYFLNGS